MSESRQETALSTLAPRIDRAWYILARSGEVGATPIVRMLYDVPIVLFRTGSGAAAALLDRCPHRNVPLSLGQVVGDRLACKYHGWQFSAEGRCEVLPGLPDAADSPVRRCGAYAVREQQGFVWVWGERDGEPVGEPFRFRLAEDRAYTTVVEVVRARASVHAVIENALDVPHTAFLHGGLFREDRDRKPIRCVVRRFQDHAEAEYIGEARPSGIVGRILSPGGGLVTHFDRFYLPGITEVEYRIGDENHILLNGACTPTAAWDTTLYAVVSLRTRVPAWLAKLVVRPLALRIFAQDATILDAQTSNLERFGGAAWASTEIDLLGPHILRLMSRAARGEIADPSVAPYERETTMLV